LGEYKATVTRLFPALPKSVVDDWSIQDADARALERFLERYPREAVVLDVGTFVGVSAFHFASQPKVSEVVSIDWNPSMAELGEWLDELGIPHGPESSPDLRLLDVAGAALAHFPEQRRKVRLRAGYVGSVGLAAPADGASLVAFVDGDHAQESVEADLRAIFEKNPRAVAVLHDCTGSHAPSVLAGVVAFVEASQTRYRFRLFERLDPDPAPPNLGVLYPEATADWVERAAGGLLADPTSSLLRTASTLWEALGQQRERADRQRRRANRLEAELREVRRPWWRRFFR
jgi:hypothetical protein